RQFPAVEAGGNARYRVAGRRCDLHPAALVAPRADPRDCRLGQLLVGRRRTLGRDPGRRHIQADSRDQPLSLGSRRAKLSTVSSSAKGTAFAGDAEHDVLTVPRIDRPSYDEFRRRFLKPCLPLLITGAFTDWPATRRWTIDYIAQMLGDC